MESVIVRILISIHFGSGRLVSHDLRLLGQFAGLLVRALHSLVGLLVSR